MNVCNLVCRYIPDEYDVISVCFDIKNKNIIIQDNKNERWIKDNTNLGFTEWVKNDRCCYETYTNIPFYGDITSNKCSIVKEYRDLYFKRSFEHNGSSEKYIGVFVTENDCKKLHFEHSKNRWKKYILKETGKIFGSFEETLSFFENDKDYNLISLEEFVLKYPCHFQIIEDKNIKS
jgi:hypothetical protein